MAEAVSPFRDRVRVLVGRSLSYTQGFSYWPIRDLLRDWLGASAATSEARVRFDLKATLHELLRPRRRPLPVPGQPARPAETDRRAAADLRELRTMRCTGAASRS